MLVLNEAMPDAGVHQFSLANTIVDPEVTTFILQSATYSGFDIPFYLHSKTHPLPPGYTVSVHLFKNTFHLHQEIIDLRINGLAENSGRVGYFFRLDALFSKGIVQLEKHTYCYAYYGLDYLFRNALTWQTKDVSISPNSYSITDFFDEDTMILVLCDQYCNRIPAFKIDNYLANLFLYGFESFSKQNPIETVNELPYLEGKYNSIKNVVSPNSVYVLRLNQANTMLSGETFISHLFGNLIQKKNDPIARFLMLYQVVEIYMSKVFPIEIQSKICNKLNVLDSHKLKELLDEMKRQKSLIQSLFNVYARPQHQLETEVKQDILSFFIHINHPDYLDATKHGALTLTDLFYDIRNSLVHQYRLLHAVGVDRTISMEKIDKINWLTEALMAEVVTVFKP